MLKGDEDFIERDLQFDCVWLLQKCKLISSGLDERANRYAIYVTAIRQAFTVRQKENETNDAYRKRFESQIMTLELVGGKHIMQSDDVMKVTDLDTAKKEDVIKTKAMTKAMIFILGSDPTRFKSLLDS